MDEQQAEHTRDSTDTEQTERTGHAGVDQVIDSLAGLPSQPVDDHVAVFERAHEELRRALNEAGEAGHSGSA